MFSMLSVAMLAMLGTYIPGVICVGLDEDSALLQMPVVSESQSLTVLTEVAFENVFSLSATRDEEAICDRDVLGGGAFNCEKASCAGDQLVLPKINRGTTDPITLQECFQKCADSEDCNHFSYGSKGMTCLGCKSLEGEGIWSVATDVFTYNMRQVELVGADKYCSGDTAFRIPGKKSWQNGTQSNITLQQCFDECALDRTCNHFSYRNNAGNDQNLCFGCKSLDNWKTQISQFGGEDSSNKEGFGGNTYSMPLGFRFETVFTLAQGYEKSLCPADRQLQFKTDAEDPITLQECSKKCAANEDCNHFSFGSLGNQNQLCLGCKSLEGELATCEDEGVFMYTVNQVEVLQFGRRCLKNFDPYKILSEKNSVQECYEGCVSDKACEHFSFGGNGNAGKQKCIFCQIPPEDKRVVVGDFEGNTYRMPVAFDTVFSLAQGLERARCDVGQDVFRTKKSNDITFEDCFKKCAAREGCKHFSYGGRKLKKCVGCRKLAESGGKASTWPEAQEVFSYTLDHVERD